MNTVLIAVDVTGSILVLAIITANLWPLLTREPLRRRRDNR
jgi:hypothetical protein